MILSRENVFKNRRASRGKYIFIKFKKSRFVAKTLKIIFLFKVKNYLKKHGSESIAGVSRAFFKPRNQFRRKKSGRRFSLKKTSKKLKTL